MVPESLLYFAANFALFALVLLRWLGVRWPGRMHDRLRRGTAILFAALQGAALIWSVARLGMVSIVHPWLAIMATVEATVLLCLTLERATRLKVPGAVASTMAFLVHSYTLLLGQPPVLTDLVVSPFTRSPWYLLHALGAVVASAAYVCAAGAAIDYLAFLVTQRSAVVKAETLQREREALCRRALLIAFPSLAASVLAHALWAYLAWGSYWSWRPAGACVLILWFLLVVTLHLRPRLRWQGPAAAMLPLLGLPLALLSLALLGQGLVAA